MPKTLLRKLLLIACVAVSSYFFAVACPSEAPVDLEDPDVGVDLGTDMTQPPADVGVDMVADTGNDTGPPSDMTADADTGPPSDMADTDTGAADMKTDTGSLGFRFIKIEDTDGVTTDTTVHKGPDIDAVALVKGDAFHFAAAPLTTAADAAFPEGLAGFQSTPVCVEGAFVSIGTGPMVFAIEGDLEIEEGDLLTIYEVDEVTCAASGVDSDEYRISVSEQSDPNGTWVEVSTCMEGETCLRTVNTIPL